MDNAIGIQNPLDLTAFVEEVLQAHNDYRMRHGAPQLQLDVQLCEQSQQCAQDFLATDNDYPNEGEAILPSAGENICFLGINDAEYEQQEFMLYGREEVNQITFNFTQLVWKATQLLGVSVARSENKLVIVCQYIPPGNILGEFSQNVSPKMETLEQQSSDEGESEGGEACSNN